MMLEIEIWVSFNPLLFKGLWSLVKPACQKYVMLLRYSDAKTMITGNGIPSETESDQQPQPAGEAMSVFPNQNRLISG